VTSRWTRVAAAALAAAATAASTASAGAPDPLARADRDAAQVEARVAQVERHGVPADEPAAQRALRRWEAGERQYRLGDWLHAAVLLTEAVDEPAWSGARERPEALFVLADALRRQGLCGAARLRYADYLALAGAERRGEAVSGALDCAVRERREADVARLVAEADRVFGGDPPSEVRYLTAKAVTLRSDLPAAERNALARAAFEKVGPPFQLQAWYFRGVLSIQADDVAGSIRWFESCARAQPADDRDVEVRDLCLLALGRVHAETEDPGAAIAWYAAVPWESSRFVEALHEQAWAHVKAKEFEPALKAASFLAEIAPESPFAPEATLLRGHLLLRLGRFTEATEAFNVVINAYAPVRDEIDAILGMGEDPVLYFDQLAGRSGGDSAAVPVLPPIAVRWATRNEDVALALRLVEAIDGARRDVRQARELAERLDALLQRGGGLDAFPALQRGYAQAQAAENAAAMAEANYVVALGPAVDPFLAPEARAELDRARAERQAMQARFERLPQTAEEVEERLARMRGRIDAVDRELFRLRFVVDACDAGISGSQTWIEQHRTELAAEAEDRHELGDELRKHREVVETYEAELAALRLEVAKVRDAAGGADALGEEALVRAELLEAVERERRALEAARGALPPAARALLDRADAARQGLAELRARARAVEVAAVAEATRRAAELRALVGAEKLALAADGGALDGVQEASNDLLGRIAVRSVSDVRAQFYRLVLKADIGIVDVAWSRKRQRLEKIQQLAVQKDAEVEQLDRDYRVLLREVD
jgi:tetratricopeptide (TPR) repeat protein